MSDQRDRILEVARQEFAANGLNHTSLETIAEKAQVDLSAIRFHFETMEHLFFTVMEELLTAIVGPLEVIHDTADNPSDWIRKMLQVMDDILYENPVLINLLRWLYLDGSSTLAKQMDSSLFPTGLIEQMTKYMEDGILKKYDPMMLGMMLDYVVLYGHLVRPVMESMYPEMDYRGFLEDRLEMLMDMLESGIFTEKARKDFGKE